MSFVLPDGVEEALAKLQAATTGPSAEMLQDAKLLLTGEADGVSLRKKWPAARAAMAPFEVELSSFDTSDSFEPVRDRIGAIVQRSDPLELLIRGHLWLEYSINALLERALEDASHLDRARLSFSQRLAVAAALGLIEAEEVNAIRAINRLRNRVAHELDAEISTEDEERILQAAGPGLRAVVEKPVGKDATLPVRTGGLVYLLVVKLHRRLDQRQAEERFAKYLGQLADEALARSGYGDALERSTDPGVPCDPTPDVRRNSAT